MRAFKIALVVGWALLVVAAGLLFAYPKHVASAVDPNWLKLLMLGLLVAGGVYVFLRVFLAGMRR
jgi:hypothetical protein